jgi:hypothetical protein
VRDKATRRGEGVNGLVDDVIEVLPVERLKEVFEDKLINSPDFRRLIDAIRSPEFKVTIQHLNLVFTNVDGFCDYSMNILLLDLVFDKMFIVLLTGTCTYTESHSRVQGTGR